MAATSSSEVAGCSASVETEAVDRHDEAAKFGHDVFALGEFAHRAFPVVENLGALVGIRTDAQRARRSGRRRLAGPGRPVLSRSVRESGGGTASHRRSCRACRVPRNRPGSRGRPACRARARCVNCARLRSRPIQRHGEFRETENWPSAWASRTVADRSPEVQIRVTDDRCARPGVAVDTARTHGRDAVDELGLANRFQRLRSVGTVHGAALHEHRRGRRCGRCRHRLAAHRADSDCPGSPRGGGGGRRSGGPVR